MEGMARNAERSYVYSITAWLMFVPGSIYFALYSPWSKQHKWSAICLIWEWGLVVEIIRCILIYIILWRTNWEKQVIAAKERSEALKKKKKLEEEKNERASPKTRALIANDGLAEDERDPQKERNLTACSLHEMDHAQDYDDKDRKLTSQNPRNSKTTDDYLCLN